MKVQVEYLNKPSNAGVNLKTPQRAAFQWVSSIYYTNTTHDCDKWANSEKYHDVTCSINLIRVVSVLAKKEKPAPDTRCISFSLRQQEISCFFVGWFPVDCKHLVYLAGAWSKASICIFFSKFSPGKEKLVVERGRMSPDSGLTRNAAACRTRFSFGGE